MFFLSVHFLYSDYITSTGAGIKNQMNVVFVIDQLESAGTESQFIKLSCDLKTTLLAPLFAFLQD